MIDVQKLQIPNTLKCAKEMFRVKWAVFIIFEVFQVPHYIVYGNTLELGTNTFQLELGTNTFHLVN